MTYNELINNDNYYNHHTASEMGYVSRRREPEVHPYRGRFGEGYKVLSPRWDTTQYVYVTYYIRKEEAEQ